MTPTEFQHAVLRFRNVSNIFDGGGRGSGKSVALALDVVDRCRALQDRAAPLVTRESWSGLYQLQGLIADLARQAFGKVTLNKSEGTLRIHGTGSIVTFTQIADDASYSKHQGKSYCSLYQDEYGNYGPQSIDYSNRLRSNLRPPVGIRPHQHITANPMGKAHVICMRRFVLKSPPGVPFHEKPDDDKTPIWTWFTSNYTANPHVDQTSYPRELEAATAHSAPLAAAWLTGDWSPLGGAMFPVDPARHIIDPAIIANSIVDPLYYASGDWGQSAPAVFLLAFVLRYPVGPARAGSVIVVDEFDTADPNDLSAGIRHSPAQFAARVIPLMEEYGAPPKRTPLVIDDGSSPVSPDTVISLLRDAGLNADKPYKKNRVGSWTLINQMLTNAKTGQGPGLFFSSRCQHLLSTMEAAPRDDKRPEDVSAKYTQDHWLDALSYLCQSIYGEQRPAQAKMIGGFY